MDVLISGSEGFIGLNLVKILLKKKINVVGIGRRKKKSSINYKYFKYDLLNKKKFPKKLNKLLIESEKKTKNNSKLQINLALNYGSKKEIINAIKSLNRNKIQINEKNISNSLYTKNIPDPDLLIRTGDTKRLSNFLLWQMSYSEIFFSKKLWPDFKPEDFLNIIKKYKKVKRKYGKV